VAAELVAAERGLGAVIVNGQNFFQVPVIFVGIIMIGTVAVLMDQVLALCDCASPDVAGVDVMETQRQEARERVIFNNVSKTYHGDHGSVKVVEDVSFNLAEGEFVSLIGPSGCGKTTMLQMLAGFVTQDTGQITLDGGPIKGPGSDRGVIFQEYGVFPWLTVEKNIDFGLSLRCNKHLDPSARSLYRTT
jgi:ABC-type glutathione transport system ATPase component